MRLDRGILTTRGTRDTRSARITFGAAALALALTTFVASCRREERRFTEAPPSGTPQGTVRLSALQPGEPAIAPHTANGYDENAYAVSEGQRLFAWYNCSGCHANGGGGMGPPLMDDQWIYGSSPENIYMTIVQGRPNGMPSFGGKIPSPQIWQLVAYVRSLSALTPSGTRSARTEHMMYPPGSQTLMQSLKPKQSTRPPASEMP